MTLTLWTILQPHGSRVHRELECCLFGRELLSAALQIATIDSSNEINPSKVSAIVRLGSSYSFRAQMYSKQCYTEPYILLFDVLLLYVVVKIIKCTANIGIQLGAFSAAIGHGTLPLQLYHSRLSTAQKSNRRLCTSTSSLCTGGIFHAWTPLE